MKFIKEYWFLFAFGLPLLGAGTVWIWNFENRTFQTEKEMHEIISKVKSEPSAQKQFEAFLRDSMNDIHAVQIRQQRYEDSRRNDSLRHITDSLFLDMVSRQTVQIEQMKAEIVEINLHH